MAEGFDIVLDHGFNTVNARFGVSAAAHVSKEFQHAMKLCGEVLADEVRLGWSGQGREGWPMPLHPFTQVQKGHGEPLYHTGALADGVVVVQDADSVAVGVVEPALATRALVNERGATLAVTPLMRAFLASRGFVLRAETRFLVIPARPNFSRALGEKLPEIAEIVTMAIEDYYRGVARGAA